MLLSPVAGENSSLGQDVTDSEFGSETLILSLVDESVVFGILF
jgi:hypothetical protein